MNKKICTAFFGCLLATALSAQPRPAVPGSSTPEDSVRQHKELAEWLAPVQYRLDTLNAGWNLRMRLNATYDTTGLAEVRAINLMLSKERKRLLLTFAMSRPDYLASLTALNDVMVPVPQDINVINKIFEGLHSEVKKNVRGVATKEAIERYIAVANGKTAPEFAAPDTSGKMLSLSSFRGKYVLIDFWASWCGPCREENPNVVKAYQRFHNKNFEILSVSLDQPGKHADWVKAIQKDGLTWYHVSDLKYWKSDIAKLYAIRSIPQNFLIDPQGKIVAQQLRGEALIKVLEKLL
jgi:peroxiredoxin